MSNFLLMFFAASADCLTSTQLWNKVEELRELELPEKEELKILNELKKSLDKCRYRPDSSYVNLLLRFGAVYYYMLDYTTARIFAAEAIAQARSGKPGMKPSMLPKAFFNYAMILRLANDNFSSISLFDSSISTASVFPGNEVYAMLSYRNLAVVYYFLGDFQKAIIHARKAQLVALQRGDRMEEALAMCEEALALEAMGNFNQAQEVMLRALSYYRKAMSEKGPDPYYEEELANLYASNGNILRRAGKPHEAIAYQLRAYELYRKIDYMAGCFVSLNNVGFNYLHELKLPEKAKAYFYRAMQHATSYNDSIMFFTNMGDVFMMKNKPAEALLQYNLGLQAVPVAAKSTSTSSSADGFQHCSQKEYILTLLVQKGKAQKKLAGLNGDPAIYQEALKTFSLADKVVELMNSEQEANESKLVWRQKAHELYEQAIEVCFGIKNAEAALHYFERSRAVILNEELSKVQQLHQRSRGMLAEYSTLKRNVAAWNRQLSTLQKSDTQYSTLFNKIFEANKKIAITENRIKVLNPAYHRSYLNNSIVTVEEIRRKLLGNHDAVLEFFEGDSALYLLVVTKDQCRLNRVNKQEYEELVKKYMKFLSSSVEANRNYEDYLKISMSLYKLLFSDLQVKGGRMIVSPDGRFLPLEALITGLNGTKPRYVLHDFAISYAFSLKTLISHAGVQQTAKAGLLGMAPVTFSPIVNLSSLGGSEKSLRDIASTVRSSSVFTEGKATKANFLKHLNSYKIIQLYTHAAEKGPYNEPAIYFSDSALNLSELVTEQGMNTELVVLSACETALGEVNKGEGVFSFSRGFSALGIPSSIANLWQVENKSMYELTELFYYHLMRGEPKDLAMQRAKLDFLTRNSGEKLLPYFWASTILTGSTAPVSIKNNKAGESFMVVVAGAFSGLLIFALLTGMTNRNKKASGRSIKRQPEASIIS